MARPPDSFGAEEQRMLSKDVEQRTTCIPMHRDDANEVEKEKMPVSKK